MGSEYERASSFAPLLRGLTFALTGTVNLYLVGWLTGKPLNDQSTVLAIPVFILLFAVFQRYSLVQRWKTGQTDSLGTRIFLSWLLVSGILMFMGFLTRYTGDYPRRVILGWLFSTPLLFFMMHVIIRSLALRYFAPAARSRSAVIVFVNSASQQLAESLHGVDTPRFNHLGFFEDRDPTRIDTSRKNAPILGNTPELAAYVNQHRVEVVFVVLPAQGIERAMHVVEQLGDTCASVYYLPDFKILNMAHLRLSEIGGMPAFTLIENPFFGADGLLKRSMDVISASLLLACLSPAFLVIAVTIRLSMGSPVFFTQRRYGLDGQQINVHKFRTMRVAENGDHIRQASRGDPRVTPLGRFLRRSSLDELPQLLNVVTGEMSLVGPRPHAVAHNEEYRKLVKRYMVRHKVKPGLTGWAQVNGLRGETRTLEDMEKRVEYDLAYIVSWSPGFDMKIVICTLWIIFRDDKAY